MAKNIANALTWSAFTEIAAKLISPIVNMALARILTPDAFGVVATLTMIISFAEIFTDAGFQRYLIQHDFRNNTELNESTNVAFWSNLSMSLFFWIVIALFANQLAALVGCAGLGIVLTVACVSIPLCAFSSIQVALYKRHMDFKTLFKVRMIGILVPVFVTIPLAFCFHNYWALIIGIIFRDLVNSIILSIYSNWKPRFCFSTQRLREMFSFSMWSVIDSISVWLTLYVDVFIVGTVLSQHYLGLYKTSSAIVGSMFGLVTSATTPVLFSALSRLQNNYSEFHSLFFRFQKYVALLVVPAGVFIFCYSDLVTYLLLGNQWMEASGFVGLWGLTSSIQIVLAHYCGEIYKAKGLPKLSVLAQWLHIVVLWPTVIVSVGYGFETLYTWRSWIRLEMVFVNLFIVYKLVKFSPLAMFRNVLPEVIASLAIVICAYAMNSYFGSSIWSQVFSAFCGVLIYISIICMFPTEYKIVRGSLSRFIHRKY